MAFQKWEVSCMHCCLNLVSGYLIYKLSRKFLHKLKCNNMFVPNVQCYNGVGFQCFPHLVPIEDWTTLVHGSFYWRHWCWTFLSWKIRWNQRITKSGDVDISGINLGEQSIREKRSGPFSEMGKVLSWWYGVFPCISDQVHAVTRGIPEGYLKSTSDQYSARSAFNLFICTCSSSLAVLPHYSCQNIVTCG